MILGESMSLWKASINSEQINPEDEEENMYGVKHWLSTHSFLADCFVSNANGGINRNALRELEILARDSMLGRFATNLRRRLHHLTQPSGEGTNTIGDKGNKKCHYVNRRIRDEIEAPESIGVLTFGLLIRLAHKSIGPNEEVVTKKLNEIALECARISNDDWCVFSYLHRILKYFLPGNMQCHQNTLNTQTKGCTDWIEKAIRLSDEQLLSPAH